MIPVPNIQVFSLTKIISGKKFWKKYIHSYVK